MSTLFTPMLLDALTLAKRIIVAPMCQYSADEGEAEQALERVIRAIRRYSAMPLGLQQPHAGRKASTARPWHAAAVLGAHVNAPPQYWRSQPRTDKTLFNEPPVRQG